MGGFPICGNIQLVNDATYTFDVQGLRFSALFAVRPDLDPTMAQVAVERRLADVEVFRNLTHTELAFFVQRLGCYRLFLGSSR